MAKDILPADRGTKALDEAVREITESVGAQRSRALETASRRNQIKGIAAERESTVPAEGASQIDRSKELARELECDEDEAAFDEALKRLADVKALPKHEPKKRGAKP